MPSFCGEFVPIACTSFGIELIRIIASVSTWHAMDSTIICFTVGFRTRHMRFCVT